MRKWISPLAGSFILWAGVAACQGQATQTSPADQPSPAAGVETPAARSTTSASSAGTPSLAPFAVDLTLPFAFATPQPWSPQAYAGTPISLPVDLAGVANPQVLDGLTEAQRSFLAENGFVVIRSGEQQFNDIRYGTAFALGQPFFRTTDEAYHALHLLFDDLLKALERQVLRPEMARILQATRDEVRSFADETAGTALEGDVQLAEAYLEVAIHLFDPEAPDSQALPDLVAQQIEQILAAGGRDKSVLFPGFEDDYGAYKPVGHYAGDPGLEQYFRGLTWLGRVHLPLAQADDPAFQPSRLPLVITLALRRAEVGGKPASEAWADVHRTLDFLIGPTDDAGPIEYAQLMDQVYGPNATPLALADEGRWVEFQASAADLPAPQINSTFVDWTADLAVEKGWRFMGQRFTMDANIFQNLVFDKVLPRSDGQRRELPTGLDVMAVFGSEAAREELIRRGELEYPNYEANLQALQDAAESQPEDEWLARFYSAWLYSFLPVLEAKAESFPSFMRTEGWGYKDLNAALGSWAELKHDTILYTKMAEAAGGGGPPMSEPAPSYLEPNPAAFYRMAYVARAISDGLMGRLDAETLDAEAADFVNPTVSQYLSFMANLADQLDALGALASKQLSGQAFQEGDNGAITACLGYHECTYTDTGYNLPSGEMPEVPIVAAVAGSRDSVLEAATGYVDRIYVVVPLEGGQEIAQGGVYSYYEFKQPRDQRLTDDEWRAQLDNDAAPPSPSWADRFSLEGGSPAVPLFFRTGDTYIVTEAGKDLRLRQSASTTAPILGVLMPESYITIIDGPVEKDGYTWWKVSCEYCSFEGEASAETGWVVEDQAWYVRSYRP